MVTEENNNEKDHKEPVTTTPVSDAEASAETVKEQQEEVKPAMEEVQPSVKSQPESELTVAADETHEEETDDHEHPDLGNAGIDEIIAAFEGVLNSQNFALIGSIIRQAQPLLQAMKDEKLQAALEKFKAEGGDEADFQMHWDEQIHTADAHLRLLRDRRSQYLQQQENQRQQNLKAKQGLLDKLRSLVDAEEDVASNKAIRAIQDEWKKIGNVPGASNRELWDSYKALMDRYYDKRSIYNELKDLDRKRNLEAKIEICEKAEQLAVIEDIRVAIKALNELHEEFKNIGPVPADGQNIVWERFKAASDAIYSRRKEHQDKVKSELNENFNKKKVILEKAQVFASFQSDRISDWNSKTKELQSIQKEWEAVGGLPREKSKDLNKAFWAAFKSFYQNKGRFFKSLESEREINLNSKKEMVAKAEQLAQAEDLEKAINEVKKLQAEWKTIGPVPEKFRESIYKQFKKACDQVFDKRRSRAKESEKVYLDNLKQKEALCEEIVAMAGSGATSTEQLEGFLARWSAIGFVPRESMRKIQAKFNQAVEAYAAKIDGMTGGDVEDMKMKVELFKIKSEPDANRKLNQKEAGLRKKISSIENEIVIWRNNMEFFANSLKADKLKKEFEHKIQNAENQIEELKKQLEVLKEL
jgi:hypothetical protein